MLKKNFNKIIYNQIKKSRNTFSQDISKRNNINITFNYNLKHKSPQPLEKISNKSSEINSNNNTKSRNTKKFFPKNLSSNNIIIIKSKNFLTSNSNMYLKEQIIKNLKKNFNNNNIFNINNKNNNNDYLKKKKKSMNNPNFKNFTMLNTSNNSLENNNSSNLSSGKHSFNPKKIIEKPKKLKLENNINNNKNKIKNNINNIEKIPFILNNSNLLSRNNTPKTFSISTKYSTTTGGELNKQQIIEAFKELEKNLEKNLKDNKINSKSKKFSVVKNYFEKGIKLLKNVFNFNFFNIILDKFQNIFLFYTQENKKYKNYYENLQKNYNILELKLKDAIDKLNKKEIELNNYKKEIESIKNQSKINLNEYTFAKEQSNETLSKSFDKIIENSYSNLINNLNQNNLEDLDALYFNDNFDINKSKNSRNFENNVPKLNFTSINKKNNNYYNVNNNNIKNNNNNIKKQKNEKKNNFNWNLNINHCQKKVFNFISNSNSYKYNIYKNN